MNKQIKYFVRLHPDIIPYFDAIIDTDIFKDGIINCYSISYETHFLEIETIYHSPPDFEYCIHFSIPYSFVLYIASSPDVDLNKIHGFRGSLKKSEPQED